MTDKKQATQEIPHYSSRHPELVSGSVPCYVPAEGVSHTREILQWPDAETSSA